MKKLSVLKYLAVAVLVVAMVMPIISAMPVYATAGWLYGWSHRVKLTIDQTDIDTVLSNFPILVYLSTSSGINGDDVSFVFDELQSDANCKKIAVTTSDGETQCYVEIEKWDDANEQAWLWVKAPSIASDVDTDLYLYYDSTHEDNIAYVSGAADSGWVNYAGNPILAATGSRRYHEPSIVYENGGFTLWANDVWPDDHFDLYRLRSTDGINFTDDPATPVLEDVLRVDVKKINGTYYAFGKKAPNGDQYYDMNMYGWQSNDGISWTAMNSGNPIINAGGEGDWDYSLETKTFTKDDNTWKVLYQAGNYDGSRQKIGYAEGATFPLTKDGSNPIIEPPRWWAGSEYTTGEPDLIELSDGTKLLFMSAMTGGKLILGVLKSTTLNSGWQDLPCNPILVLSGTAEGDSDPAILYDEVSGYLWLYYNCDQWNIHLARFKGTWSQFYPRPNMKVWDDNFVGVWHKNDLTTSLITDSTAKLTYGTKKAANEPIEIVGKIGKAQSFDGTDDMIFIAPSSIFNLTQFTVALLFKTPSSFPETGKTLLGHALGNNNFDLNIHQSAPGKLTGWFRGNGAWRGTGDSAVLSVSTWYQIVMRYDQITFDLYLNGAYEVGSNQTDAVTTSTQAINICRDLGLTSATAGLVDEVRISNIARSVAWLKASYESERDHLLDFGDEELEPPTVTTLSATNIYVDGGSHATLRGSIDSLGGAPTCNISFQWGYDTNYGNTVGSQTVNATGIYAFELTGFSQVRTVHYRFVGQNVAGTSYGADIDFAMMSGISQMLWNLIPVIVLLCFWGTAAFYFARGEAGMGLVMMLIGIILMAVLVAVWY